MLDPCTRGALLLLPLLLLGGPMAEPTTADVTPPPPAEPRAVADDYHGETVTDDYRWLEAWDPQVEAWIDGQNAHSRSFLDALPNRDPIEARVRALFSAGGARYASLTMAGDKLFALRYGAQRRHWHLWSSRVRRCPPCWPAETRASGRSPSRRCSSIPRWSTPAVTPPSTGTCPHPTAPFWPCRCRRAAPRPATSTLFETSAGQALGEVVPHVQNGTGGGDVAWLPDGAGFFYTRYPRTGERAEEDMGFFQQVYFHRLGTHTDDDRYEFGKNFPRIAETRFEMASDGRLLVTMQEGDSGRFRFFLRDRTRGWHRLADYADQLARCASTSTAACLRCPDWTPRAVACSTWTRRRSTSG